MTETALDPRKTDALAEQMLAAFNGAALALMTSIGHRTGLFDTMALLPPATTSLSRSSLLLSLRTSIGISVNWRR